MDYHLSGINYGGMKYLVTSVNAHGMRVTIPCAFLGTAMVEYTARIRDGHTEVQMIDLSDGDAQAVTLPQPDTGPSTHESSPPRGLAREPHWLQAKEEQQGGTRPQ